MDLMPGQCNVAAESDRLGRDKDFLKIACREPSGPFSLGRLRKLGAKISNEIGNEPESQLSFARSSHGDQGWV